MDGRPLRGRSLLVTGGAGFVGASLVREALAQECARVVVVDNLLSSERENLPADPRVELREGSIASAAILEGLRDEFDAVFHLATFHGNQNSIADPLADHENNLVTTLRLFERIRAFRRVRKVVYAASGCTLAPHTFGPAEATPEEGLVPFEMDSPYQISKVVGELYAVYFHRADGLPTVRARFQNVYGPGEILGAGAWRGTPATVWRNVTPVFVYRGLKGLPLQVDDGGAASRDFVHVDDVVRGLVRCAEAGRPGDVYNLASGDETSILELATLVNELTGNPAPLEVGPGRAWDRAGRRFGATGKSAREIGFETRVGLRQGLTRTIAWTRANIGLIDRCVERHRVRLEASAKAP